MSAYFFTVNLLDRSSQHLITYIDDLRKAFHGINQRRPFKTVIDWPYSSFLRYVRNGLLEENWGGHVMVDGYGYGE